MKAIKMHRWRKMEGNKMSQNDEKKPISIIRYGEWKWSEIIFLPDTKKYIKNDYEEEWLDTGTRHLAEYEISFDEVLSIVEKSVDALLKLQLVSGKDLEKEIEIARTKECK